MMESPFVIEDGILHRYSGGDEANVPEGVIAIGPDAFRGREDLVRVRLPSGLTKIGRGAFWGCSGLETIDLPDHLESVEDWAFYGCTALRSISFPPSTLHVGECSFRGCTRLEEAILPNALTEIGVSAFEGCAALRHIQFPRHLRRIGENAFRGCTALESPDFPEDLSILGDRAFWGCESLTELRFPDSLETIGKDAFYYCIGLSRVSFPDDLRRIGSSSFYGCTALSEIRFPTGAVQIGRNAFAKTAWLDAQSDGCVMAGSALYLYKGPMPEHMELALPAATRTVSEHAFCGCSALERAAVPEGAIVLGENAFEDCTSLREVSLPETLCVIGPRAFLRCGSIRAISLPDHIAEIGDEAFKNCVRLEDVTLPRELRTLGTNVFYGCESVKKLSIPEDAAFYLSRDGVLFTRSGRELALYPPGRPDRSYAPPEGTEQIRDSAFSGVFRLGTLFLPGTLESLSPGTFTKCAIRYARLPRRITRLPVGVFRTETYVGVYYADLMKKVDHPVFLGGGIDQLPGELRHAALQGFLFALGCSESAVDRWRSSYLAYIRRNESACARIAARNETLLHLMMEEEILTKMSLEKLLAGTIGKERTDLTAELLAYQDRVFPRRAADMFSLADEAPQDLVAGDAAKKREALLQRIGIGGLRFAVAGRLKKFGYYSPRGVVDFSDLRSYLKKRGAVLRSEPDEDTDCLICSDPPSAQAKLARAAQLGIPVISEEEFLRMADERPRSRFAGY